MMKKSILLILIILSGMRIGFGQQYGWVALNPASIPGTPDLSDLYFTNDNTGWITSSSLSSNNVFKTTDGGQTFTTQNTTLTTNAIHMVSATEGYCGGGSGFVFSTSTGGGTWSFLGTIVNTLTDISFSPVGGIGYACGLNGTIYSVTSAGVTAMTSGVNGDLSSITFPVTSDEGWVCGGGSVIRHYTSGAWTADQVNITGSWNGIHFIDNQNGWVVGDRIKHTTNGKNWSDQTNPDTVGRAMLDVFFLNVNEGWIVGNQGLILHTTNGGTSWAVEGAGLTNAFLTGVHFTSPSNGYITGNVKTLLKYTQITSIGDEPKQKTLTLFPNPTTGKIQSSISLRGPDCEWTLYDIFGRPVCETLKPTNNEIDISSLAPAVYLLKIKSGEKVYTQKIIRQ